MLKTPSVILATAEKARKIVIRGCCENCRNHLGIGLLHRQITNMLSDEYLSFIQTVKEILQLSMQSYI